MSIWGPAGYYSENAGPLVHETSPIPRILAWCHHRSQDQNDQKVLVLPPMVSAKDPRKQGALSPFCLRCDFFRFWRDYSPIHLTGDRGVTPGSSGRVRFLLFHYSLRSTAHVR